jgi:hypothetical protein
MAKPELDDMSYDELTRLIDAATNVRTTKFESEARELEARRKKLAQDIEDERIKAAVPLPERDDALGQHLV